MSTSRIAIAGRVAVAGRRGSWTPGHLGAPFNLSTDPACLTVAGSAISAATDAFGSGVSLTASGAGMECTLDSAQLLNGLPALRTTPGCDLRSLTGGVSSPGDAWDMIVISRVMALKALGTYLILGRPDATHSYGFGANTANELSFGNNFSGFDMGVDRARARTYRISFDGTTRRAYVDGKLFASGALTPAIADASICFAGFAASGGSLVTFGLDARVWGTTVMTGRLLVDAEVELWTRYECARLNCKTVALFGDSTTAGGAGGTTAAHYFPDATVNAAAPAPWAATTGYLVDALVQSNGNVYRAGSTATSGSTTPSGITTSYDGTILWTYLRPVQTLFVQNWGASGERSDQIAARLNSYTGPCTHVFIYAGINDANTATPGGHASTGTASGDAALIYDQIVAMVAMVHAMGALAVVATIQLWNMTPGGLMQNTILALNVLIIANSASADGVADIAAAFGVYNPANFCVDTLHPNDTANDTLAGPTAAAALATV